MNEQVIDLEEVKGRKYLENLVLGDVIKINIAGKTYVGIYKLGNSKMIGGPPWRSFKFAIKHGEDVMIAECLLDDLKARNEEIYLPQKFFDFNYLGWSKVSHSSDYYQRINNRFVKLGI